MKKTQYLKSMWLAVVAMLAVSTTLSLTACSSDDEEETLSLYKQWIIDAEYMNASEMKLFASQLCYDLTGRTTIKALVQAKVDFTLGDVSLKKGKWYTLGESPVTVGPTSDTEGTITIGTEDPDVMTYKLTKNTLTLTSGDDEEPVSLVFKAASGIKSEGNFIPPAN